MKPNRFCGMMLGVLMSACGVVLAQEAPKRAGAQVAPWLEKMDQNGDGKLAKVETKGLMLRYFDQNDANKDGVLDETELKALAKRLQGRQRTNQKRPKRTPGLPAVPDDVAYLRIDGAGHGVYGQARKQTAPAMEKFFARTLKRK